MAEIRHDTTHIFRDIICEEITLTVEVDRKVTLTYTGSETSYERQSLRFDDLDSVQEFIADLSPILQAALNYFKQLPD